MKRIFAICSVFAAGWLYAFAPPAQIRVRLFSTEQPSAVRITTADGQVIALDARKLSAPFRSRGPVKIQNGSGDAVALEYPVEVSARNGTLLIITELPLDDYVAAVLAGEASGFRSEESLKAMAVAARTYAVHFLDRHKAEGFHFCDTTHCQDFRITAVTGRLRKAAAATSNEVVQYGAQPIAAYYHQNCGGTTEARAPYLTEIHDTFCTARGRAQWSAELTMADLQLALGVRDVKRIDIVQRTSAGRAEKLQIGGLESRLVDAETFRLAIGRSLGWNKIRSDMYDVRRSAEGFMFEGYGAGHGIGLCQEGAAVMGEQGRTYRDILNYYYPHTTIAPLSRFFPGI